MGERGALNAKTPKPDSDRLGAHVLCGLDVKAKSDAGKNEISVISARLGKKIFLNKRRKESSKIPRVCLTECYKEREERQKCDYSMSQ